MRMRAALVGPAILVPALLASGPVSGPAAPQTSAPLKAGEFRVIDVEPFPYCAQSGQGPFEAFQEVLSTLWRNMQSQNVSPQGAMMAVFLDDPVSTEPERLRWEIGFPVLGQTVVYQPLAKHEWIFPQVAATLHVGPYSGAADTMIKLREWMDANGWLPAGPVVERYMDMDPDSVRPENLQVEIWVACKRAEEQERPLSAGTCSPTRGS